MYRKEVLNTGEVHHVFNKSIAGFKIINNQFEFKRIISTIRYYQAENCLEKFSRFIGRKKTGKVKGHFSSCFIDEEKIVEIIAYCIMPTHLHLILKQLKDNGISIFMRKILDSYAKYFNTKLDRKGPLWEGRFKNVLVETDEQLLHLTRYIHLNPVTAYLVDKAEDWEFSSYNEYIGNSEPGDRVCNYCDLLDIQKNSYKEFVEAGILDQRSLAKIKELVFE